MVCTLSPCKINELSKRILHPVFDLDQAIDIFKRS